MINWKNLTDISQLDEIVATSETQAVLLFKHSTRCSISTMAKGRLERSWNFEEEKITPYYLDLLAHRDISAKIAERFGVEHASPQVLLIKNGQSIYDASHQLISVGDLEEVV